MDIIQDYLTKVIDILEEVKNTQTENIEKASEYIAESCRNGGYLYVFGTGHSHIMAEEIYIRAGGLALVRPILEPALMLHEMPNKSTLLERLDGYSKALLKLHKVTEKDVLLIISNSGRNPATVEMALEAKKLNCKVIALTSLQHSSMVSSRHKSGLRLFEAADVVIDTCGPFGDAAYYIKDLDTPVGPTSDILGTAIVQALVTNSIDKMTAKGYIVPVFKSSNVDGADEYNEGLFEKYYGGKL